jgi:nucleoid DNA-binding protein
MHEIIKKVAEAQGLPISKVSDVVKDFISELRETIITDGEVKIHKFAIFKVVDAPKSVRNIYDDKIEPCKYKKFIKVKLSKTYKRF